MAQSVAEHAKLNPDSQRITLKINSSRLFNSTFTIKTHNIEYTIPPEIAADLMLTKNSTEIVVIIEQDNNKTKYKFQKDNSKDFCFALQYANNSNSHIGVLDLFQYDFKKEEANGVVYVGGLLNGMKHGKGSLSSPNGSTYVGQFVCDQMNGECTFFQINKDGTRNEYNGTNINGQPHGSGKMKYADGREYDGQWKYGVPHGNGKMTYPDLTVSEGKWRRGAYCA